MRDGTIVALATPKGVSAIAVVRASGGLCRGIFGGIGRGSNFSPNVLYRTAYASVDGERIDDTLAVFFAGPNSYTGEDSMEIHCHGNMLIVEKILGDLCLRGCRIAEPGEFTKRAFLNGKLDLCQAEAVADVIHGSSARAIAIAQRQLGGALSEKINSISRGILGTLAAVEREIDFSDDGATDGKFPQSVAGDIGKFSAQLDGLIGSNRYRSAMDCGIATVILGAPNAGKSSLFNFLLARDRSIVSPTAGTTRDLVSERVTIGDRVLNLWDTAGFGSGSGCEIEKIGIGKAVAMAREAELFLVVVDVNAPEPPQLPDEITAMLHRKNTLLILNKIDLARSLDWHKFLPSLPRIEISLKNFPNPEPLKHKILSVLSAGDIWPDSAEIVTNSRHTDILRRANGALLSAKIAIERSLPLEIVATEMARALETLGEIVGAHSAEHVLDAVFSNFCVGK
jgi:tRNA modification GTPase